MEFRSLSVILLLVSLVRAGHAQGYYKPVLTVQPLRPQIFTGETVTLTCYIPGERLTDWMYQWIRDNTEFHNSNYYIRKIKVDQSSKYRCCCYYKHSQGYSGCTDEVTLTVTALPTATLTVDPTWSPVFTGESVTLKCEIQSYSNWRYQWYKGSSRTAVSQSQTNTFTIRSAADQDQDQYWCRGERDYRPSSSQFSNRVGLSVNEKPKPELTSSHKGAALIGNPVVLYCELDQSAGWRFYWSKHTQSPENETKPETHSYTISSVSVSDGGQYWCRAGRGTPVYYTHYSDALWINTTDVSPPVSLMVSPSRTQHFSADSLSLSCEGQSDSTGWRVRRYTHSQKVSNCSSGWGSVTGSTCSISSLSTSHTGLYWCESESGESSNPVNITVTNNNGILDSPVHPIMEGDPLTLHCLYRDPKPTNLTAEFYKDGSLLQTQTTGEMTIRTVSKSDEGLYHCKHPERGESPQSGISVRTAESAPDLVIVVVGVSFAGLFIILLILLWCYRTHKGHLENINQMSVQNQRESGAEDSQSGHLPVQAGDVHVYDTMQRAGEAADELSDVTYSQVLRKNKKLKNKDADTGSMEVTYAEIELKTKKKPKKKQEMISVNADTVYSEVKQNTNEGKINSIE
uniref:Ig-like domain-containing protein n=1 Tax=Pygocentrus nattereri TaxID=42514 RepID=A0AAR2LLX3_PYGNA